MVPPSSLPEPFKLVYLAEGAANIVYKFEAPSYASLPLEASSEIDSYGPGTPPPTEVEPWEAEAPDTPQPDYSILHGKLLRLRKSLPSTTPVVQSQHDYETLIAPLLSPDFLVQQALVSLPSGLVDSLNAELRTMEDDQRRPANRHGVALSNEGVGVLVTDMSPQPGNDLATIEVKPKWLVQSRTAPAQAVRCRTCALRAMRGRASKGGGFCPLILVGGGKEKVERAVEVVLRGGVHESWMLEALKVRTVDYIMTTGLFGRLRELQEMLDPVGLDAGDAVRQDFLTAMTLRDCSLFLKVPVDVNEPVEGRLGDLDLKSSEKGDYWTSLEKELIDGGWYEGRELVKSLDHINCELQL